ncbi:MAG: glycoside hydrolase family 127 protein [Clostridia bacterium]|nr:glycoside hydrolase family 127 protein [Clostridia bacterium]
MENTFFNSLCTGSNATAAETDKFYFLPHFSSEFKGFPSNLISFIEKEQLMNPELWKIFVDQFRFTYPDDQTNSWKGEFWGKMMRGASFVYRYTGNKELYKILEDTARDLLTAQDSFGRISSYSVPAEYNGWDMWNRKYVLLGFQYFLEICEDKALEQDIIKAMCAHADYIMKKVGPMESGKVPVTRTSNFWRGLNASSILEPYVRLYNLTGEKKYLDFAEYLINEGGTHGFNIIDAAIENKLFPYQYPVTKAYEMMSYFEGVLEYYRVTGIEKYKTAVVNFTKRVIESDITIIGCAGCTHELFDFSRSRQVCTEYTGIMQETCVTVTWMKLLTQVIRITGESLLADSIELSAYNALAGSVNTESITRDNIMPFDSYAPLLLNTRAKGFGGRQPIKGDYCYGCCAAIGAAGMGLIPMTACMLSRDGVVINLYIAGNIKAYTPSGKAFDIKIDTAYPNDGTIKISLGETGEAYKLYLRIPAWSEKNTLTACGKEIKTTSGEYAVIDCCGKACEVVLTLDMRAKLITPFPVYPDKNAKYHVALQKGPIVMARDARLGEQLDKPVDIISDRHGYVEITPTKTAKFDTLCEYSVPCEGGNITVIDFSSAGKTYNEDSLMTVWMPTKNYWEHDLTKPLVMFTTSSMPHLPVCKDDGEIILEMREKYAFENVEASVVTLEEKDGKYTISFSGKLLTANADDTVCAKAPDGSDSQLWYIEHITQDRYRVRSAATGKYFAEIPWYKFFIEDYKNSDYQTFRIVNI